jgi:acyl-CoA synthetase (AMP-forming)/AMP-acid ligase II
VLLADERIVDAVVVRKRDATWGELPVAFIARRDERLTEAEVEALCRRELAAYKRPKDVRFVAFDDLPRSTSGKILRHEMEKRL